MRVMISNQQRPASAARCDVPTGRAEASRASRGMTTAELLGNAALGIAALVAIWAVLQTLGLDVVDWMRGQLRV